MIVRSTPYNRRKKQGMTEATKLGNDRLRLKDEEETNETNERK